MMLTELADVARGAGLTVVEERGWPGRGHGAMSGTRTVTVHHTAGPTVGDAPSLATVRDGRPDLAGPLAHILLARSGTVHVIAAGLAWHAGATLEPWQANAYSIGIEVENAGTPADRYPPAQLDALQKLCRALCDHYGIPVPRVLGHREICAPAGRKIDPLPETLDMRAFRASLIRPLLANAPVSSSSSLRQGDRGALVASLQRWLNAYAWVPALPILDADGIYGPRTAAVVREAQAQCGVTGSDADGTIVGPRTRAAFQARGWSG